MPPARTFETFLTSGVRDKEILMAGERHRKRVGRNARENREPRLKRLPWEMAGCGLLVLLFDLHFVAVVLDLGFYLMLGAGLIAGLVFDFDVPVLLDFDFLFFFHGVLRHRRGYAGSQGQSHEHRK